MGAVVYVNAGNALAPPSRNNHGSIGDAERIKAELILQTAAADQIDAMALGEEDWRLGLDWLRQRSAELALPVLAANLECDGVAPFPASRVVERAGLKVGIVGVTSGQVPGCIVSDPIAAAGRVADGLRAEVDVVVGLLPLRLTRIEEGADLGIDLAVSGGEPVKYEDLVPWRGGYKAASGGQTKHLGAVGLYPSPGATGWAPDPSLVLLREIEKTQALRDRVADRLEKANDEGRRSRYGEMIAKYDADQEERRAKVAALAGDSGVGNRLVNKLVPLDEAISDHPETLERVTSAKARVTAAATGGADVTELVNVPHLIPGDGPFVGADACQSCHTEQHTQWRRTSHARAYKGLVDVDRAMDPECYSCHVTGADSEHGPREPMLVGPFRDVQCEACHGPGRAHIAAPATVRMVKSPDESLCITCHDGERDMGRFELERYLKRVSH
ncbi:MAG: hypothetical protein KC912_07425 [Proteobacteria bacterium]|nr:hypothetical protein [Pseudomonadota bacterium]